MKLQKKLFITAIILSVIIIAGTLIAIASPGDESDPLVTLSYINDKLIPELKSYIDTKIGSTSQGTAPVSGGSAFTLVNVKANHQIIGGEGTEFVLRMGNGTIVATSNGGVADLTQGVDLPGGTPIPPNHNLLSPKQDSRGLHMDTDGIVLIKGTYTVIPD